MPSAPPLSQGFGYGIILGLGFAFALGMILTTWLLKRYNNEVQTSEMFSTAGRTVKSGLVASAVVSSWTWAATLLQSSGVAYRYGVSGPFWYASGATVQIILFATLAIQLKRRAPNAHTFLEVIRARYGVYAHVTFIIFGLMTNILVTAMLLTGGAAVVTSLTGVHTVAACFLLPVGVVLYTMFGGIKATFLTDYVHTVMILVIIFVFAFTAYATNDYLGSPGRVYDLLVTAAQKHPVDGNTEGSYLTMRSQEGAIFFVINIVGNFGTVFCDNGYYNKAIAASPVHALPGYVLGGLSWFAIPWLAATTMGLSCIALESSPTFPTYPLRMPDADVTAGLVLPNAAVAMLGSGGAAATLLLIFMAVTSASSSEFIAVSSIFTYDIYQTYFNPKASGKVLINMAHVCVVVYAILLACFSTALYYIGISMGYLYLMMGVIISSAVLPATLTLMWSGQNLPAVTLSPILGLACSLIAWLVTAKSQSGELTVASTGANNPMLAGNVVALLSPLLFIPVLTYVFGQQRYDWASMQAIRLGDDTDLAAAANVDIEAIPGRHHSIAHSLPPHTASDTKAAEAETLKHKDGTESPPSPPTEPQPQAQARTNAFLEAMAEEQAHLTRSARIAGSLTIFLTVALLILWPMPLYGSAYVFSKPFFTGWVVVGIIWLFFSSFCVGIFPLWEGRHSVARTFRELARDLQGKGRRGVTMEGIEGEGSEEGASVEEEKAIEAK